MLAAQARHSHAQQLQMESVRLIVSLVAVITAHVLARAGTLQIAQAPSLSCNQMVASHGASHCDSAQRIGV